VLAYATPENREVLGGAGFLYEDVVQLRAQLQELVSNPELRRPAQESAMHRARRYSWEAVTDQYEVLFRGMVGKGNMLSSNAREGVDSRE
jgi:glycosyltransferase involved in cell wall biosynthesis